MSTMTLDRALEILKQNAEGKGSAVYQDAEACGVAHAHLTSREAKGDAVSTPFAEAVAFRHAKDGGSGWTNWMDGTPDTTTAKWLTENDITVEYAGKLNLDHMSALRTVERMNGDVRNAMSIIRDLVVWNGGNEHLRAFNEVEIFLSHPAAQEAAKPIVDDDWKKGFFDRWNDAAKEKGYHGIAEAIEAAQTKPEQAACDGVVGYIRARDVEYLQGGNKNEWRFTSIASAPNERHALPVYATPRPSVAEPVEVTVNAILRIVDEVVSDHGGEDLGDEDVRHSFDACLRERLDAALAAQPMGGVADAEFVQQLRGRAQFLRDRGEVKSPELLERAAAALTAQPHAEAKVPDGWKVERGPDVLGQPAVRVTSPEGEEGMYGIFQGERLVRDFLVAAYPLAAAPEVSRG